MNKIVKKRSHSNKIVKDQQENNTIKINIIFTTTLLLFCITLSTNQASTAVNMKKTTFSNGNHGGIFYTTNQHKSISKQMAPSSQTPQQIVTNQWESVTYSPEETYIKLEKKIYKGKTPSKQKKLSFSEIASKY